MSSALISSGLGLLSSVPARNIAKSTRGRYGHAATSKIGVNDLCLWRLMAFSIGSILRSLFQPQSGIREELRQFFFPSCLVLV
ncbi:hypothetical protein [Bradyrhizobium sp. 25ACV]